MGLRLVKQEPPSAGKEPVAAQIVPKVGHRLGARQTLGRAKDFVEMCGRHPLATGLFAILGFVGLIFSVVTFGLDQSESRAGQKSTAEIKDSLGRIELVVTRDADDPEPAWIDPLETPRLGSSEEVLLFSDQYGDKTHDWLMAESSTISAPSEMLFSIKSSASNDYVQIASYLVVDVLGVREFPENLMASVAGGMGGPEQIYSFTAALVPRVGQQHAPMTNPDGDGLKDDVDFLSLAPGEIAEVSLAVILQPDFIYRYRIGIPFKYRGRREIHWVSGTMQEGLPSFPVVVRREGGEYTAPEVLALDQASAEIVRSYSTRNEAWVRRSRVFPP